MDCICACMKLGEEACHGQETRVAKVTADGNNEAVHVITSSFFTNSFAVGAETMIWRAFWLMKPSSTALSMKDSNEL